MDILSRNNDIEKVLSNSCFIVAGVGNELKAFDRAGVDIARAGSRIYPDRFVDCGIVPENYLEKIVGSGAEYLVIVDVISFEADLCYAFFYPEELALMGLSTHALSLEFIAQYLKNSGVNTFLLGINSERQDQAKQQVLDLLLNLLKSQG